MGLPGTECRDTNTRRRTKLEGPKHGKPNTTRKSRRDPISDGPMRPRGMLKHPLPWMFLGEARSGEVPHPLPWVQRAQALTTSSSQYLLPWVHKAGRSKTGKARHPVRQ